MRRISGLTGIKVDEYKLVGFIFPKSQNKVLTIGLFRVDCASRC